MKWDAQAKKLSDAVAALRFALIDLALFLDTHPDDADALRLFSEYNRQLAGLEEQYNARIGPLTMRDVGNSDTWTWGETPLPFEGGN